MRDSKIAEREREDRAIMAWRTGENRTNDAKGRGGGTPMDGKHTDKRSRMSRPLWREGVGPVAVAAAFTLVVAGAVDLINRLDRPSKKAAADASDAERRASVKASRKSVAPRYVVAVRRPGSALVVRDARTGKDIGMAVAAPTGRRFHRVTAAGGHGTFVVSSYASRTVTFSRLRIGPDGRPRDLIPIRGAKVKGVSDRRSGMAVSPDGGRIAYVTYENGRGRLQIVGTDAGPKQARAWTTRLPGRIDSLSWAGETVSYVWNPARPGARRQVRSIDAGAKGGDLSRSRPVLRLPAGSAAAVLTADGRTVLTAVSGASGFAVEAYATGTGRRTRALWRHGTPRTGPVTALTPTAGGGHVLAAAANGKLYDASAQGLRRIPGEDLADASW